MCRVRRVLAVTQEPDEGSWVRPAAVEREGARKERNLRGAGNRSWLPEQREQG